MGKLADVHAMVHSLTKAEKRGFRLSHRAQSGSQHIKLLDCLLETTLLEEANLLARLKKKGLEAQLPTHVLRLRKSLLKFLIPNIQEQFVEGQLNMVLGEISFLYQKRLLDQIPSSIRKAKKVARKYSKNLILLRLIDWERILLLEKPPRDQEEVYQALRKEESDALATLMLQRDIADLQLRMRSLARKILRPSEEKDKELFNAIVQDPVIEKALKSDAFLTKIYARHALGLYYIAMLQYGPALETYTQLMETWKAQSDWINEESDLFLANFNNFQISFLYSHENDVKIPATFADFFSQHQFQQPRAKLRFQHINYSNTLVLYLNSARFVEGKGLAREIEGWLSIVMEELPKSTWLTFQYNLAVFHFLAGDSSTSNRCIQEILNFEDHQQRRDIKDFAHLFEMILQHDLGHHELVEYRRRAMERNYTSAEKPPPFIKAVLDYFKPGQDHEPKQKHLEFRQALEELETSNLGLQELKLWVESKLSGKSITDVFKKKLAEETG